MKRLLFALSLSFGLCVMPSAVTDTVVTAKVPGPCDGDHGMYTDRLCVGDHIHPGAYIHSPNARYRFYLMGDGHAMILDTIDEDNWVNICTVVQPHANPGKFQYSWQHAPSNWTEVNWIAIDDYDNVVDYEAFITLPTGRPDGQTYLWLTNNGHLAAMDESGVIDHMHNCD